MKSLGIVVVLWLQSAFIDGNVTDLSAAGLGAVQTGPMEFKLGLLAPFSGMASGSDFSAWSSASAVSIAIDQVHSDPSLKNLLRFRFISLFLDMFGLRSSMSNSNLPTSIVVRISKLSSGQPNLTQFRIINKCAIYIIIIMQVATSSKAAAPPSSVSVSVVCYPNFVAV